MKTKEELNAPKEEVETQDEKIKELTDEELAQVSGGVDFGDPKPIGFDESDKQVFTPG